MRNHLAMLLYPWCTPDGISTIFVLMACSNIYCVFLFCTVMVLFYPHWVWLNLELLWFFFFLLFTASIFVITFLFKFWPKQSRNQSPGVFIFQIIGVYLPEFVRACVVLCLNSHSLRVVSQFVWLYRAYIWTKAKFFNIEY